MTYDELPDPLIERLRAFDPARTLDDQPERDAACVEVAERRHVTRRRRRRATSGIGVLALAATLAFALVPGGRGPSDSSILVGAVQASQLPPGSIVVLESIDQFHGERRRFTTWLRTDRLGHVLAKRERRPTGREVVQLRSADGSSILVFDGPRGRPMRSPGGSFSSAAIDALADAHRQLVAARAATGGGPQPKLTHVSFAGRAAYRLRHLTRPGPHDRRLIELLFDAASYRPLRIVSTEIERDRHGKLVTTHGSTQILSERILPDSPSNRRFLRFHGPVR